MIEIEAEEAKIIPVSRGGLVRLKIEVNMTESQIYRAIVSFRDHFPTVAWQELLAKLNEYEDKN